MADGRSFAMWGHTSNIMALLANIHRDPKKSRPFGPSQFNPHAARQSQSRKRRTTVEQLANDIMRVVGGEKRKRRPLTGLNPPRDS